MSIIEQVLETERASEEAVAAARAEAAGTLAAAKEAKQKAVAAAETQAEDTITAAKYEASKAAEKTAADILASAEAEAKQVKSTIENKQKELTDVVVKAFSTTE